MTIPTEQIAPEPTEVEAVEPSIVETADRVTPWWRRARVVEAVASAIFTVYVAWPFLSLNQYVTIYDTFAYSGPNLAFTFRELRAGHLPTWNDTIFNGVPHLANAQTAPLSPIKFLFLFVEVGRALELITATNLILLGVGAWFLFARRLRLRPPAAFIGTVAVMGSGLVMTRGPQFEQIAVITWLPWLLAAIDYAAEQGRIRPRGIAAVAAATGMMCVSGHPNQIYICLPFIALWAGARVADHGGADVKGLVRRAVTVGAGAVLGAGVAAVQLLVLAAQLPASVNTAGRTLMGAADPTAAITPSFIPSALIGQTWSSDPGSSSGSVESLAFVGITVCVLALLGAGVTLTTRRWRWTGVAMIGSVVLGVLLAVGPECQLDANQTRVCQTGGHLYRTFFDSLPGFAQGRVPGRWILLTTFALAVLAALAVDAVVRRAVSRSALVIGGALVAICLLTILTRPVETNDDLGASKVVWIVAGGLTVVAIAALVLAVPRVGKHRGRTLQLVGLAVICGLVLLELGGAQRNSIARLSMADQSFSQITGPTADWLRQHPERSLSLTGTPFDDTYYFNDSLRPNSNATVGVRTLDGYDGGVWVTRRYVNAVDPLTKDIYNPDLPLSWQIEVPPNRELLARYGVRYIVVDAQATAKVYGIPDADSPAGNAAGAAIVAKGYTGPVFVDGAFQVFENPDYTSEGGVYFHTWPVAQDPDTLIHRLGDVTPEQALVPLDGPNLTCDSPCPRQPVDLQRPRPGQIDATVTLDRQGLFVVPEQAASGWTATVDGAAAPIVTVDSMSQGVLLPPGHHDVELRYIAPGERSGLLLSAISLVAVILLAWEPRWIGDRVRRWRQRRRS
jgi:hypothetical protein